MKSVPVPLLLLFVVLPVTVAFITGAGLWLLGAALLMYMAAVGWGIAGMSMPSPRRFDPSGIGFMLVLFVALPIGLASVTGASWATIGYAYLIWFGLLALWALQMRGTRHTTGEAVGWPLIAGMFLTMGVVPVLSLVLRLARVG